MNKSALAGVKSADADFTIHMKKAAVLADNSTYGRQAQPGALGKILGRKKRLEDTIECSGVHAGTGISDG